MGWIVVGLFAVVVSKGTILFLGDDAGFEANTYQDFSIDTKGNVLTLKTGKYSVSLSKFSCMKIKYDFRVELDI